MDKYKELIELLRGCSAGKSCQKCRREKDPLCMVNFMAEAADAIEELLKVQDQMGDDIAMMNKELLKHEWIPVSERPPEDLQEVAITWINRVYAPIKDIPQTGCAVYYDGCWYWSSATCIEILKEHGKNYVDPIYDGIEITAWQPLPEPYKEKKE